MGQLYALLWPKMQSHLVLFGYQTLLPQWGYSISMADTTNATYSGGIDVPHFSLSGAKISIIHETAKLFPIIFMMAQKQRGAGPENLRPLCIELLQ